MSDRRYYVTHTRMAAIGWQTVLIENAVKGSTGHPARFAGSFGALSSSMAHCTRAITPTRRPF